MSDDIFLTPKEQVQYCKAEGICFNRMSKSEAVKYLEANRNYFKLRTFRNNYVKDPHLLKYTNLDFADLVDLSSIDSQLRRILLEMVLSIEHFSKLHLIRIVQKSKEDGYAVVRDYINQLSHDNQRRLSSDLKKNSRSLYCKSLFDNCIKKNITTCPIWVFVEIISLGQYLHFYDFCCQRYSRQSYAKELKERLYLLWTVKDLRNACAHNNCIINDFRAPTSAKTIPSQSVNNALIHLGISTHVRRKHLRRRIPTHQIITTFYTHTLIVSSLEEHNHVVNELQNFKKRLFLNSDYTHNDIIYSSFKLLEKLIDNWFIMI